MRQIKNGFSDFSNYFSVYFSISLMFGLMLFGFVAQTNAQGSRRNDKDTRDIVRSLRSKIDDFQYSLTYQLKNNSANQDEVAEIDGDLRDLSGKINDFEENLDRKRENREDVNAILNSARIVNDYLSQNPQNRRFQNDWSGIRSLLDRLAVNYNIPANGNGNNGNYPNKNNYPNQNNYPNPPSPSASTVNSYGLTGTYRLDTTKSENANDVIADSNINNEDQRRAILDSLESPDQIAIDVRGNQITLASTKISPSTYNADGRDVSKQTPNGLTVRMRATLSGQQFVLSSDAGGTNSSTTFVSTDNGQTLKVTRSLTTDYLNETIFVDSIYRKTEPVARLGIGSGGGGGNNYPNDNGGVYSSSDSNDKNYPNNNYSNNNNYPTTTNGRTGNFVVPNGTIITGNLDNDINTKLSQNNDRFKMTVQSPDEYRGATIEGYISGVNRSGKVSGRSQITFNFERITLRDGQTYDFAGFLQNITDQNGKTVKIDEEGTAQGNSQTKETIKRGGIAGGIGAVIGAIAGGAKGAAIGAVIGGGAGAGSVIAQGKDDLEIKQGSSITVQSSSPSR